MSEIKFTYFIGGQASFMKAGLDALGTELEPVLDATGWENTPDPLDSDIALKIDTRPTMDVGVISGLVIGLFIFVANWAGGKALDEFYDLKLKRPLGNFLKKAFHKAKLPNSKCLEYQHLVNIDDQGLSVLIRLMINSEAEIENSIDLLLQTHKNANQWINDNGKKARIHCYVIQGGNCNLEPMLYNSLSDIQGEEREKVIRKVLGKEKS